MILPRGWSPVIAMINIDSQATTKSYRAIILTWPNIVIIYSAQFGFLKQDSTAEKCESKTN